MKFIQGIDFVVGGSALSWRLPGLDKLADAGAVRDDQLHEAPSIEQILGATGAAVALADPFGSREFTVELGNPIPTVPVRTPRASISSAVAPAMPAAKPSPARAAPAEATGPRINIAAIYARRREPRLDGAATPAPAATPPATLPAPKTFGELAARIWGARRAQAAGREAERSGSPGLPATQTANCLPDPADVYARRCRAAA